MKINIKLRVLLCLTVVGVQQLCRVDSAWATSCAEASTMSVSHIVAIGSSALCLPIGYKALDSTNKNAAKYAVVLQALRLINHAATLEASSSNTLVGPTLWWAARDSGQLLKALHAAFVSDDEHQLPIFDCSNKKTVISLMALQTMLLSAYSLVACSQDIADHISPLILNALFHVMQTYIRESESYFLTAPEQRDIAKSITFALAATIIVFLEVRNLSFAHQIGLDHAKLEQDITKLKTDVAALQGAPGVTSEQARQQVAEAMQAYQTNYQQDKAQFQAAVDQRVQDRINAVAQDLQGIAREHENRIALFEQRIEDINRSVANQLSVDQVRNIITQVLAEQGLPVPEAVPNIQPLQPQEPTGVTTTQTQTPCEEQAPDNQLEPEQAAGDQQNSGQEKPVGWTGWAWSFVRRS